MKKLLLLLATFIPFLTYADTVCVDGIYYELFPEGYNYYEQVYGDFNTAEQFSKSFDYPIAIVTSKSQVEYSGYIDIPSIIIHDNVQYQVKIIRDINIGLPVDHWDRVQSILKIPESVEIIDNDAFYRFSGHCEGLTCLYLEDTSNPLHFGPNALDLTTDIKSMYLGRPIEVSEYCIETLCKDLEDLSIGPDVTDISWFNPSIASKLKSISSAATYPPVVNGFTGKQYDTCELLIQLGNLSNYEEDEIWTFFKKINTIDCLFKNIDVEIATQDNIIEVGENVEFKYEILPNVAIPLNIICSDSRIISIDDDIIHAKSKGAAQVVIGIPVNGKCSYINIRVIQPVTKVTLNKESVDLDIDDTTTIFARVSPEDADNKSILWSTTDDTVALINDGTITAVGGGECDIIATAHNGVNAKCHVKVKQEASGISFNTTLISMNVGEQSQIEVTFSPENTTERELTWTSSNPEVANVVEGLVKAIGRGEATITATTSNGLTATCAVNVIQPVESVTISQSNATLNIGETLQLTANVNPANANDQSIIWSSDNLNIVTVSESGLVTAVMTGEATVTATASNGASASCNVTVRAVEPESISLDLTEVTIYAGDSQTLTATITPADVTDAAITWSTSDPGVATVEDGVVTGVAGGSCTVKVATVNGLEAACEVTVREKATEIELSETELNLEVGETHQLTVTFYPETTTERHVTWVTSDASVATVNDGLVTVVGVGTARIKANYALGISATCVVNATADVDVLLADGATCDVYTVTGILVRRDATRRDLERLTPDVYILRRGATVVKLHLP